MSKCILCGSNKFENLGKVKNGEYDKIFLEKFSFLKCRKCSFVFMSPPPSEEDFNIIYSDKNYSQWEKLGEKTKEGSSYLNFKYYSNIIKKYKNHCRVLDCGCGTGIFMDAMKEEDFDCFGVETSKIPLLILKNKYPGKIFEKRIEDSEIKNGFFQVVTMFDFIEHVQSPRAVLRKTHTVLSDDGFLFIITPNIKSLSAILFGTRHNDYNLEHIGLFDKNNISTLLKECGFRVLKNIPAEKIVNLEFAEKVFKKHTNILFYPINFLNKLLPKKITRFPIKLHFGGMFIVAKKA